MNRGAQCIAEDETLLDAAKYMKDLGIGSLPIQSSDGTLIGMLTDRDIVVKGVATGTDPATITAGSLATGEVQVVEADDDIDDVLSVMRHHQVKRLPVLSGGEVIGIISESDLCAELDGERLSHVLEGVYEKS